MQLQVNYKLILFQYKQIANDFNLINYQMSKKFQYNFTLQSEFEQLKQKNSQLQQENNMLKQSIEELIKVNNQLTQSIEELNNNNNMQNNQLLQERFQMLLNQNNQLRDQLQHAEMQKHNKKEVDNDDQTQNLVNVLEELIQSFKNIELKYQSQIKELQQNALKIYKQFQDKIVKIQQELTLKANTMQALSIQLNRKNQIIETIQHKFNAIEKQMKSSRNNISSQKQLDSADKINYENKINEIKGTLQEKERVIKAYQNLLANLKHKIMEKY